MGDKKLPREAYIIDDRSILCPPYSGDGKGKVVPIDKAKEKKTDVSNK